MEKRQNTIKYRLLVCIVAAMLAIGLSAMPALAEPSAEKSGSSISIVSVDASSEEKTADKKEPAKSEEDSGKSEAPAKSESATTKPVSTDSLNPAEKLGAVLEGEGEAAVKNATGITAQATGEEDEELDEKEQAKEAIKASISAMSASATTYYGDLSITKNFVSGPLYTVLDKDGNAVIDEYTVLFEIEGKDADGNVIYAKRTIGLKVGKDGTNSETFNHLPAGTYTVREIVYPGCGYTLVEGENPQEKELTKDNEGNPLPFTFTNRGDGSKIPNQGFVNHYKDYGDKGFGWTTKDRD